MCIFKQCWMQSNFSVVFHMFRKDKTNDLPRFRIGSVGKVLCIHCQNGAADRGLKHQHLRIFIDSCFSALPPTMLYYTHFKNTIALSDFIFVEIIFCCTFASSSTASWIKTFSNLTCQYNMCIIFTVSLNNQSLLMKVIRGGYQLFLFWK